MDKKLLTLRSFLNEDNAADTLVFAYGRFQPPTIGHALLVHSVEGLSRNIPGSKACVFVSNSVDKTKNPLTPQERVHYLSRMFPRTAVSFSPAPTHKDATTGKPVAGLMGIMASLSKKFKKIVLVAGSDRVPEFERTLNKYNGKVYQFQSITVVSAGERDPDDEGAAGMSGTKMRAAAYNMDYEKFRSGIPQSLSDLDTKELMLKIRKSMSLKESLADLHIEDEDIATDSTNKAIFLIGGTGSGKDFVLDKTLSGLGLTEATSDNHRLQLMKNHSGIIINTTGESFDKISTLKEQLSNLGYESKAVFVTTSNEVSKERNLMRNEIGKRSLAESVRFNKWSVANANREKFRSLFGEGNYMEFDNSVDLRNANEYQKQVKALELSFIHEDIKKFISVDKLNEEFALLFGDNEILNEKKKKEKKKAKKIRIPSGYLTKYVGSGPASIPVIMKKKKRLDERKK